MRALAKKWDKATTSSETYVNHLEVKVKGTKIPYIFYK
jgi:hypothetical protein